MDRDQTLSTEMAAPAEISDKSAADERPYAFIFVCRDGSPPAGMTIDEAFLNALRSVDTQGATITRVCRGGILIAQLAYKPAAIAAQPPKTGSVTTGVSTTQRADMHLYATLVGDFVESCLERWNTFEPSRFWEYVAKHSLDATIVTTLPVRFGAPMDAVLRAHPQYIGVVEPDLGNPLHRHLFVECMFKDAFIRSGQVVVQADSEGSYEGVFDGADTFSPAGMAVLPYEQFEGTAPSAQLPPSLSARGLVSQMRWQRLTVRTVHEKLIATLEDSDALGNVLTPFAWDLNQLPHAEEHVEVQARKLTDYLLDPTHKDGKSKAVFFEKELAIVRVDWAYLHAQLVDGLQSVLYEDVRLDPAWHPLYCTLARERQEWCDRNYRNRLDRAAGRAGVVRYRISIKEERSPRTTGNGPSGSAAGADRRRTVAETVSIGR